MNKTLLKKLTISVSVISMLIAVESYAVNNSKEYSANRLKQIKEMKNKDYQYSSTDIRDILKIKIAQKGFQDKVELSPAIVTKDVDGNEVAKHVNKVFKNAKVALNNKKRTIIQVDTGVRWFGIITAKGRGKDVAIIVDSGKQALNTKSDNYKLFTKEAKENGFRLVQYGTGVSQNDGTGVSQNGTNCGDVMVENVIETVGIDGITNESVRKVKKQVGKRKNIRENHFTLLAKTFKANEFQIGSGSSDNNSGVNIKKIQKKPLKNTTSNIGSSNLDTNFDSTDDDGDDVGDEKRKLDGSKGKGEVESGTDLRVGDNVKIENPSDKTRFVGWILKLTEDCNFNSESDKQQANESIAKVVKLRNQEDPNSKQPSDELTENLTNFFRSINVNNKQKKEMNEKIAGVLELLKDNENIPNIEKVLVKTVADHYSDKKEVGGGVKTSLKEKIIRINGKKIEWNDEAFDSTKLFSDSGDESGSEDESDSDDEENVEEQKRTKIQKRVEEIILGKKVKPEAKEAVRTLSKKILTARENATMSREEFAEELRKGDMVFNKKFAEAGLDDKAIAEKTKEEKEMLVLALIQNTDPEVHEANKANAATTTVEDKQIVEQVDGAIAGVIGDRINETKLAGIAAGDDDKNILHGVWAKALYANNIQKKHGTISGYRGRVAGGTVGVDFAITDDLMAGLAYSNLDSRFKHKDALEGNKLNARTHVVSIYGSQKLNDKFTLQGAVAAGISRVKTERLNNAGGIIRPVSAKYNHRSFSANAFVSYNYDTGKGVVVIPSAGVRYNHHINGAFTESGAGVNNIKTEKDTHDTVFGVVGTRILTKYKVSDQWSVIPSLNLSAEYLFNNKAPKVKSRFVYMDKYFDTDVSDHKLDKIRYNVGASLLAKTRNIEVTAGYNLHLRKKYQGHQASIKLNYLF